MTDLSPREKELVEELREMRDRYPPDMVTETTRKVYVALRAYDHPKREFTMPTWEEFHPNGWADGIVGSSRMWVDPPTASAISKDQYNAIREATSKEVKP